MTESAYEMKERIAASMLSPALTDPPPLKEILIGGPASIPRITEEDSLVVSKTMLWLISEHRPGELSLGEIAELLGAYMSRRQLTIVYGHEAFDRPHEDWPAIPMKKMLELTGTENWYLVSTAQLELHLPIEF